MNVLHGRASRVFRPLFYFMGGRCQATTEHSGGLALGGAAGLPPCGPALVYFRFLSAPKTRLNSWSSCMSVCMRGGIG